MKKKLFIEEMKEKKNHQKRAKSSATSIENAKNTESKKREIEIDEIVYYNFFYKSNI